MFWRRAIILVDMNAFFASVEQLDNPSLQGRPIAITNGEQGSCIITCSYEARAYGVKTGMRLREGLKRCPQLRQVPSRPYRYAEVSTKIMTALLDISPDLEIFSVDEAFLDVTHCQKLWGDPVGIAYKVKRQIYQVSGLPCSLGLSGDKTTAKYAAKLQKPNGFSVIPPEQAKQWLADVPVTELCGVASGIGRFLALHGVYNCGDMAKLPISVLARRFGNIGRRIWYMAQGADPEPIHTTVAAPQSMGHGKIMPPATTDPFVIQTYLLHMCEKLAKRLRVNALQAQHFFVGLRSKDWYWLGGKYKLAMPTCFSKPLYTLACLVWHEYWHGEPVFQVQITALDPKPFNMQGDFFSPLPEPKDFLLQTAIDTLNDRYGEFCVMPARLLCRSKMHNVIAPAWKPDGHRQSLA